MPGIFAQALEAVFTDTRYGQPRSHGHPQLSCEVLWGDRGPYDSAESVGRLACFGVRRARDYKDINRSEV